MCFTCYIFLYFGIILNIKLFRDSTEMISYFSVFFLGPYMLLTGLTTYLLSKELYVINYETMYAACLASIVVMGVKMYGPSVAAFADKLNEVDLYLVHPCIV